MLVYLAVCLFSWPTFKMTTYLGSKYYWKPNAFLTQKVFIFDRFYKGFRNALLAFQKPRFRWFYKAFRHGGMSCGMYL